MSDVVELESDEEPGAESPTVWRVLQDLLVRREKFFLLVTLGMSIVNSLIEILALVMLLPLTNRLLDANSKSVGFLDNLFSESTGDSYQLLAILAIVILVYIVKNLFSLTLVYVQQRLSAAVASRLVQHLFSVYLTRPYSFHLRTNSSLLVRNVIENASSVLGYFITPLLTLSTDISVALAMMGVLLYVEPVGTTATVAVFTTGTWMFLRLTRSIAAGWGAQKNQARQSATKALLQGLGGVKEIKLAGCESQFLEEHLKHQRRAQRATYLFATFQQFPRAVFETLAFVGVGLLVAVFLAAGRPASDAVGVLAIFAAAAFRILPSLQRVTVSFQNISFGRSMVDSVYHDLREEPHISPDVAPTQTVVFSSLALRNVTFAYEAAHHEALSDITFNIARGEYVGVIGTSGAGKSTLIDVLLGLLQPDSGEVLVNGANAAGDITTWQRIVGYVPQEIYLLDDSIRRNVAMDIRDDRIDDFAVEEALRAAQLWDFVLSLPDGLDTETGERGVRLSGGQRQRLGIARALYRKPQVLVFDEATSALDSQTESEVVDAVERLRDERTVIIVAHRLSTVRHCDRLYVLEAGRIVRSGTYDEIIGASEQL